MLRLPAINRRWIQWSLRGFLLTIAVLAAGLAWYGARLRREARINHAVRLIEAWPEWEHGEYDPIAVVRAVNALQAIGKTEAIEALRRFVPTPNLHYLAASTALADGRAEDAIVHFRRCLNYRGQVLVVPIQEGITGHVSLAGIAQAWMLRGDLARAERLLAQAIALEPAWEPAHLALSRLWLLRGENNKALQVLTTFLATHPDSPGACQQTTLILQRLGQPAAAKQMGRHAVRLLEARALDHEAAAMTKLLAAM